MGVDYGNSLCDVAIVDDDAAAIFYRCAPPDAAAPSSDINRSTVTREVRMGR